MPIHHNLEALPEVELLSWAAAKQKYKLSETKLIKLSREGNISLYPISGKLFINRPEIEGWLLSIAHRIEDMKVPA